MFDPTLPSPTSQLGINVRTYHIKVDEMGLVADIDLGEELEAMAEMLYDGYVGPDGVRGFEKVTRAALQESLSTDVPLSPLTLLIAMATGRKDLVDKVGKHRILLSLELAQVITTMLSSSGMPADQLSLLKKLF